MGFPVQTEAAPGPVKATLAQARPGLASPAPGRLPPAHRTQQGRTDRRCRETGAQHSPPRPDPAPVSPTSLLPDHSIYLPPVPSRRQPPPLPARSGEHTPQTPQPRAVPRSSRAAPRPHQRPDRSANAGEAKPASAAPTRRGNSQPDGNRRATNKQRRRRHRDRPTDRQRQPAAHWPSFRAELPEHPRHYHASRENQDRGSGTAGRMGGSGADHRWIRVSHYQSAQSEPPVN